MLQSSQPIKSEAQPPRKSDPRILELDAIRALTCQSSLLFPFTSVYQRKYGFAGEIGSTFPYEKYGVQLFFKLSGLVNAPALIQKRRPGDLIASRRIRIFPSCWLVILLNVVLLSNWSMYNQSLNLTEIIANLTTLPKLFGYENMELATGALQVEMLFYLILMIVFSIGLAVAITFWFEQPITRRFRQLWISKNQKSKTDVLTRKTFPGSLKPESMADVPESSFNSFESLDEVVQEKELIEGIRNKKACRDQVIRPRFMNSVQQVRG